MASEIMDNTPQIPHAPGGRAPGAAGVSVWLDTLGGFWTKLNNDWIFNLAGLLAYNFLMALFPLLLLLLAGCGLVLDVISPAREGRFRGASPRRYPGATGRIFPKPVRGPFKRSWGYLLVFGRVAD